jgi:hypothetical protein
MIETSVVRLPGVYLLPPPRAVRAALPRLDVAAFVGFAERGPLDRPVAVEDLNAYRAVFGGDLPLARDAGARTVFAHLPRAVMAFFANGGRRCYVVRVAGARAARARFRIPAVVAFDGGQARLAGIHASWEGRWADRLRLASRLVITPLPVGVFTVAGRRELDWATGSAPDAIQAGDVLRLTFADGAQVLLPVAGVAVPPEPPTFSGARPPRIARITGAGVWRLEATLDASPPLAVVAARRLTLDGEDTVALGGLVTAAGDGLQLDLTGADAERVERGDVLRLELSDGSARLFPVRDLGAGGMRAGSAERQKVARAREMIDVGDADLPVASPPALHRVERLRFDLQLWEEDLRRPTLEELAFNAPHARFWGEVALLDSSPLFRQSTAEPGGESAAEAVRLYREARDERLPEPGMGAAPRGDRREIVALAGLLAPLEEARASVFLPLGMPAIFGEDLPVGPDPGSPARDDLDTYEAGPFLDPYLVPEPYEESGAGRGLMEEAFHRVYVQRFRLRGLHSLLLVEDVALLAVPDAVHRDWITTRLPVESFRVPILDPPWPADDAGALGLAWSSVAAGPDERPRYQLEEAEDPAFTEAVMGNEGTETSVTLPPPTTCPAVKFYRVRAAWQSGWGPWSNTRRAMRPPLTFETCDVAPLGAPRLDPIVGDGTHLDLSWSHLGADVFTVEEALDPAFATATVVFTGPGDGVRIRRRRERALFYRVRARRDAEISPWSNTQPVLEGPREVLTLRLPDDFQDAVLLAVQRAALHLCAARADVVAVLSVPAHFEKRDCIGWLEKFRRRLGLPARRTGFDEDLRQIADLSYAAVYHPWLLTRDEDAPDRLRPVPPDGAVCGMIAARERARGAWVAPANVPLAEALGLTPALSADDWVELFELQFNLVRPEPRDFRAMSAHTLADDRALLQLSVRRLMILLRKVAAERGMDFVFEPNDERFREGVRLALDEMLRAMFARGAFAGDTPQQAFRVVTDATVNPSQSVDQGRFIALIQVAPSQPLEFLTVLLTRVGENLLQATEA